MVGVFVCLFVFHIDYVQLFLMSHELYLPTVTIFEGTREVTFQMWFCFPRLFAYKILNSSKMECIIKPHDDDDNGSNDDDGNDNDGSGGYDDSKMA